MGEFREANKWSSRSHFAFNGFSKEVSPHTLWMKEASFPVKSGHMQYGTDR